MRGLNEGLGTLSASVGTCQSDLDASLVGLHPPCTKGTQCVQSQEDPRGPPASSPPEHLTLRHKEASAAVDTARTALGPSGPRAGEGEGRRPPPPPAPPLPLHPPPPSHPRPPADPHQNQAPSWPGGSAVLSRAPCAQAPQGSVPGRSPPGPSWRAAPPALPIQAQRPGGLCGPSTHTHGQSSEFTSSK